MKTRQEIIYDFMVALSSNASVFDDWNNFTPDVLGSYSNHVMALAEEMADKILGIS
jgi:hypothetical protein